MKNRSFHILLKTTGIGLLSGLVGGIWLMYAIHQKAEEQIRALGAEAFKSAGSIRCAAGTAASVLFILSLPAGAIFGFILGGSLLLLRMYSTRRLP